MADTYLVAPVPGCSLPTMQIPMRCTGLPSVALRAGPNPALLTERSALFMYQKYLELKENVKEKKNVSRKKKNVSESWTPGDLLGNQSYTDSEAC